MEMRYSRWERSPRVVAIGGGHGLSTLLRGLKYHTRNLTGIVTVFDDGGGSGMLRSDLNMLPPGDIRNCMEALANTEPVMEQLLSYRFPEGSLKGQAFGNLLLAALNGISGSFDEAVAKMSQVLAITGRILPVTNGNVALRAVLENGTEVVGESKIPEFQMGQGCRIREVSLNPEAPAALPEAVEAIRNARLILLGPGSLYTSVIPNLLVEGIPEAIRESSALKIYVGNIMTQGGETEGMTLSDHVAALLKHGGGKGLVDLCLANVAPVPREILERYWEEGAEPILVDREKVEALGVEVVERPMISAETIYARHAPHTLADTIMEIFDERAETKII